MPNTNTNPAAPVPAPVPAPFELSDSALMVLGALKGNNPADVLMMLPRTDVQQILANRTEIVKTLNEAKLSEVESNGAVDVAVAKIRRKVKLYDTL